MIAKPDVGRGSIINPSEGAASISNNNTIYFKRNPCIEERQREYLGQQLAEGGRGELQEEGQVGGAGVCIDSLSDRFHYERAASPVGTRHGVGGRG